MGLERARDVEAALRKGNFGETEIKQIFNFFIIPLPKMSDLN